MFNATPVPDLTKYYIGGYQKIPGSLAELRKLAAKDIDRLEPVLKFHRTGRLLEIGSWIGLFCVLAKDRGFSVTAIDMDRECVEFLRKTVGTRAILSQDPADTLANLKESFDVITLWHSIEHVPRPWDVIRHAARRLNANGTLLIAAPNPESGQMKCLRQRWYHLDAPRHRFLLPMSLIDRIGRANGLEPVYRTTGDSLSRAIEREAWRVMIHPYVPIPGVRRAVKVVVEGFLNWIYRTRIEGNGAGYTIVLRASATQ